jgi:N4-gp56 family major capsid protein
MDRSTFERKTRTANFANEVTATTARGSALSGYVNDKVVWQGDLSDGAKNSMFYLDSVDVRTLPEKNRQYVVNYRKYYPTGTSVSWDTSELTAAATNYGTNLIDGVVITPTPYTQAATITNFSNYHNIRDLVRDKMDELSYALADKIDIAIALALGDATETTSTVAGAMTIYGGTATSDATLAAGGVLTPALINYAEVLLSGKTAYYWTGGVFTASSGIKNPWRNEPTDPYVLLIGQRQKQALRDSSQFVSVAEYGSRVVISSGEIGDYIGVRVVVSNNAESVAASGTAPDGGSAPSVNMTRCLLIKGRAAYTFVWGRAPRFEPWTQAWSDLRGITLTCDFAGSVVHSDAVIKIDVADL